MIGTLDIVLLVALVAAALATVMMARTLQAVIALASTSAVVTLLMFRFDAPIAGVFELSVCAGLIPAIFISTIGLTRRLGPDAVAERWGEKLKRYWYLPVLVVLAGLSLMQLHLPLDFAAPPAQAVNADVRDTMWNLRHLDLLGQIAVLLAGAFGIVVLLKGNRDGQ
jgi:NADH-quinone oxidoreductase subunit J